MTRRSPIVATALAVSLLSLTALGVSAGGPSDPIVVRTAPAGTDLEVVDGDSLEGFVAVLWVEEHGGVRNLSYADSDTGGSSWAMAFPPFLEIQAPRLDLCGPTTESTTFAGTLLVEGARAVRFVLESIVFEVSDPGVTYSRPDVACAPDRRAFGVALRTASGATRLRLYSRDLSDEPLDVELDLGPANKAAPRPSPRRVTGCTSPGPATPGCASSGSSSGTGRAARSPDRPR